MKKYLFIIPVIFLLLTDACQKGEINSLNTPVVGGIITDPSRSDLFNLVTGAESGMRNNFAAYLDGTGIMGREIYRFSGSEPRYTTDLLGGGSKQLDNNTFYIVNPWGSRYQVIRQSVDHLNEIRAAAEREEAARVAAASVARPAVPAGQGAGDQGMRTGGQGAEEKKNLEKK